MKQVRVKVTKNYMGNVSVRDYKVAEALEQGADLVIEHKGQTMTIPAGEVALRQLTKRKFDSKFEGKPPYYLIDFWWTPDRQR